MQSIATKNAPNAIGPYSQAVRSSGMVFLSGQVALDPATGKMVTGDTRAEAERVMQNLDAVLQAAGLTFDHVVKTTIYLIDFAAARAGDRASRGAPEGRSRRDRRHRLHPSVAIEQALRAALRQAPARE
jgi:enamine deaminase RidA (YjgF/YER057c/UK114 family)